MFFQKMLTCGLFISLGTLLWACEQESDLFDSKAVTSVETASPDGQSANPSLDAEHRASQADDKSDYKLKALENPDWVSIDTLPPEWGGLYQKDCVIGGPEKSNFFDYHDAKTNMVYYFTYVVYPKNLNRAPIATFVEIPATVWQNETYPDHYLLFQEGGFSQIVIADGWSKGQFQKLDGQAWDSTEHFATRYKTTDAVRWSVDTSRSEDFGSRPPCSDTLAQPWAGQVFKSKSGKSVRLTDLVGKL